LTRLGQMSNKILYVYLKKLTVHKMGLNLYGEFREGERNRLMKLQEKLSR